MTNERVDIEKLASRFGAENLTFFLPARPLDVTWDEFHMHDTVPKIVKAFKANEKRYRLDQGYKVVVDCVEPGYGTEEFYQDDFESLARSIPDYYVAVGDQVFRFGYTEQVRTPD